jgi:drug/metabolite transporter (DMT)-like permease
MKNSEEKLLESIDIDFYGDGWRAEREKDQWPIRGGMELGTYLFVGNLLQVVGLQSVNSDRAAFLLQLTTVFVPLLQAIVDRSLRTVGVRIWGACALALIGVGIMGLDDAERLDFALQSISNQFQWSPGDSLIVLAAVAYTFHCIRLEGYAKSTSAVKLATCKAITEMTLSGMAAVAVISHAYQSTIDTASIDPGFSSFLAKSGQECIDFLFSFKSSFMSGNMTPSIFIPAILATIWTGLVPVAYTILAQSYGQSRVRPVTANLIYTIQPICTAIFAYLLLQETLGLAGFFGGTLIGAAVLLVVLDYSSAKGGS